MASRGATQLKAEFIGMADDCFEPMTFGELKIGQKFIGLPLPGDNQGHGGFRGASHIFVKIKNRIIDYAIPHGNAVNISRGIISSIPESMYVLRVE